MFLKPMAGELPGRQLLPVRVAHAGMVAAAAVLLGIFVHTIEIHVGGQALSLVGFSEEASLLQPWDLLQFVVLLLARWLAGVRPLGRLLLVGLLANVLSLPVLWLLVLWGFEAGAPWVALVFGELAVVAFEALLYARLAGLPRKGALLLSAVANGASLAVGFGLPFVLLFVFR